MEAHIAVAVRHEDGTFACRHVPAHGLATWGKDIRIIRKDRAFLSRILGPEGMPDRPVAPFGRGMVVIDLRAERILSMQDYVRLDCFRPYELIPGFLKRSEGDVDLYRPWLEEGRLWPYRLAASDGTIESVGYPLAPDDNVPAFVNAEEDAAFSGGGRAFHPVLGIDFRPFAFIGFAREEAEDMRAELAFLGFLGGSDAASADWGRWLGRAD